MPEYEAAKRQVIESILENESLTDGLSDTHAQRIIQWCLDKLEAFQPHEAVAIKHYGRRLARQARTITRILRHILDGDEVSRIQRRLQRLTDDAVQRQAFLDLLTQDWLLQDYIHVLFRMVEGG